jgi:hypothetical protein
VRVDSMPIRKGNGGDGNTGIAIVESGTHVT